MPTPFPGMNPYLERRGLWEEVHTGLIVAMQFHLNTFLRPRYRAAVEQRTYLNLLAPRDFAGKPDVLVVRESDDAQRVAESRAEYTGTGIGAPVVIELPTVDEVKERYLEIRDVEDNEVITVIELLAPSNKLNKRGREEYERKRITVLGTYTNLIEIDLLRAGKPFEYRVHNGRGESDYRIIVSRAWQRPRADGFLFDVRDRIPDISAPLRPKEQEPTLPLNQLLHELYDRAGYDMAIDYRKPADPPLSEENAAWAAQLIAHHAS